MRLIVLSLTFLFLSGVMADEPKGTPVKLDKLISLAPADWKVEKPANLLRSHQFKLAKVDPDTIDAELVIAPDVKGTPETNIQRWLDGFIPPEGKTVKDVSKVEKFDIGKAKVVYLDVSGTQIYKERPFDPKSKEVLRPGFRMLSVIFDSGDGNYRIYLTGPMKTVEKHKKAFDEWLKGFKTGK